MTMDCYLKLHLKLVHQPSEVGVKFMLALSATKRFAKSNSLHKSYLRELQEQIIFKDFSTLIVRMKMDTTNYR